MSFMMSTEDAILFSASELPQYAITNVNVSKLRKWLGLADCLAVCLLCNYQHSLQTGMSNFSSSQQADFNDGITGWVKLTGTGEWNGCPSVMNKCNKHGARQDKKKRKKRNKTRTCSVCELWIWAAHRGVESMDLWWDFPGYCLTTCMQRSSASKQKVRERHRKQ